MRRGIRYNKRKEKEKHKRKRKENKEIELTPPHICILVNMRRGV